MEYIQGTLAKTKCCSPRGNDGFNKTEEAFPLIRNDKSPIITTNLPANLIIGGFSDARGMEMGDPSRQEQTRGNPETGI